MTESVLNSETLRYVFDRMPDLIFILDPTVTVIVDVNEDGAAALGWTSEQMIGQKLHRFCIEDDPTPAGVRERASKGEVVSFDRLTLRGDGTFENYNFVGLHMNALDRYGLLVGRPMDRLLSSDSKLSDLLKLADLAVDSFVVSDAAGRIRYCNQAAREIAGESNPLGKDLTAFFRIADEDRPKLRDLMKSGSGEIRATVPRLDSEGIPVAIRANYDRESERWYAVARDISETVAGEEAMRDLNANLRIQASTDWLTRIANRSALENELERASMVAEPFTVMMLDVDDFKSVNDTLGHSAGDDLLRAIAGRLQNTVSNQDFVARLGGDEFVVMLRNTSGEQAAVVARRIIEVLREPFDIGPDPLSRSCSVGIAHFDPNSESGSVLRQADRALYRAKSSGRNRYVVYDVEDVSDKSTQQIDNRRRS